MMSRTLIKDLYKEARIFNIRAIIAALVAVILVSLLWGRLFQLQITEHAHFDTLSNNNRVRLMSTEPNRGLIYDRNGMVLAENRPTFSLDIIPEEVGQLDQTLEELKSLITISDNDIRSFNKTLKRRKPFQSVSLRSNLSEKEVAVLAVNRYRFPGVDFKTKLTRYYPMGSSAVHVLGYVGRIDEDELQNVDASQYNGSSSIGKIGIESYYEKELRGQRGYQKVEVNVQGRVLRVLEETPPIAGKDLILSIDAGLQSTAEYAMGNNSGAMVAIEPETGEVLAMVSMPLYDPNLFVHGISNKAYKILQNTGRRPQFNRALSGQYPPGSIMKPFIGLGGLDASVVGVNEEIFCEGYFMLPNEERRYRDWKRTGHLDTTMKKALAESCDVYFYQLAYLMGIDRISSFLNQFGFGKRMGIDTTSEQSGLLPSREWKQKTKKTIWYPGETLITGIGQGYMLATPLQMAAATATLAMRGQRKQPHLLKSSRDNQTGETVAYQPPELKPVTIKSNRHWSNIIAGMKEVVHGSHGTARALGHSLTYQMAGKTGTAQVYGIAQGEVYDEEGLALKLRDHALFSAFAPIRKPRIAAAIIIENGGSGGHVAAPIAKQVFDHYIHKNYGNHAR
ncbi:MAG: penicillin-binding protein 2 [Gammaproteobacteria bacterium]|nr:penicillin-binding protein 2 [Gammaproteobacteria bacterium]